MNITATDRKTLIRLASTMAVGSPERKAILAGLEKTSGGGLLSYLDPGFRKFNYEVAKVVAAKVKSSAHSNELGVEEYGGFMSVGPIPVISKEDGTEHELWLSEMAIMPDGKGGFDYQDGDSAIQLSDRNQLQLPLDATVDRITYKTPQQVASSYLASILKRVSQMGFALA
jgi:hypothetical protein